MRHKEEQHFDFVCMELDEQKNKLPVRLTQNSEQKVVKVEICVNKKDRCKIFDHFPDKSIGWKESAAHLVVLNSVAAYRKHQLTHAQKENKEQKPTALTPDTLAEVAKALCHATAPLYALVNSPYLDSPYHPSHEDWKNFCENRQGNKVNLTVSFLKQQLTNYKDKANGIFLKYEKNEPLRALQKHHQKNVQAFEEQLSEFSECVLTKNQLHKLFSHQDKNDRIKIDSLGEFLRSEAHAIVENAIPSLDEITGERFNQLFALSAHPLRREFVKAKSALEKQRSTHAVRFINTSAPIPEGQLAVLEGNKVGDEKKWLDIMPYVNCKTLLDGGVDGAEGLDDIDQILCVYANADTKTPLKKEYAEPYKTAHDMVTGKKGAWGILGVLIFGFPVAIFCAAGLLIGMLVATLIDLAAFVLQASVIILCSPIILGALIIDLSLQIPSFFTEKAEIQISLLTKIARWPIPPKWLKEIFRDFSLVRIFKQYLLEQHKFYVCEPIEDYKTPILNIIKNQQAEGVFNVVARKFFTISIIAGFLHQKIKQLVYALRELRKVFWLGFKKLIHFSNGKAVHIQQCNVLIAQLTQQVQDKIKSEITDKVTDSSTLSTEIQTKSPCSTWSPLTGWKGREYETPLDFFSDIGLALAHQLVDPAFENNPGLATPTFVASLLCSSTLLFPAMANVIPEQIVKGFQLIPQYIAKAFMGKQLEAGLSDFAINLISAFLQWKLSYFGIEGIAALYHGDIEWVKKVFENPEEITLCAMTFVALGYAAGLIPEIPANLSMFNQNYPENPFLKAMSHYLETVYKGFAGLLNTVTSESREVSENGAFGVSSLELAFIGIKGSMLTYALISGNHEVEITPLKINIQALCDDFSHANHNLFDKETSESQRNILIQTILRKHNIPDTESEISKFLIDNIEPINKATASLPRSLQPKHIDQGEEEKIQEAATTDLRHQNFIAARKKILDILHLIHDMEILGMPVYVGVDDEGVGYQSKVDAERLYDALYFGIEDYNQSAQNLGLFHLQIEGRPLLHPFYNKHCYAGSSGWHKLLFGLFLFPITWLWRGFKYLIGTPSMRHQVKKSFNKDFAMLFQFVPDIIAPILRTFLKSVLYAVRMFLGIFILPCFAIACALIVMTSIATGILTLPMIFYAIYKGIRAEGATTFAQEMGAYFAWIKTNNQAIWKTFLCNGFVNGYMKLVSLIGSTSGTGSLHRLSLLKTTGISNYYQGLAEEADTNSENLQIILRDLIVDLKSAVLPEKSSLESPDGKDVVNLGETADSQQPPKNSDSSKKMLEALVAYDQASKKSWKMRSPERDDQLAWLSGSILASEDAGKTAMELLSKEKLPRNSGLKREIESVLTPT